MNCRRTLYSLARRSLLVLSLAILLAIPSLAHAGFHIPWQSLPALTPCETDLGRGYFRPEYGELVQRIEPETMDWLVTRFPILGWQGMDSRLYLPKPVPGGKERYGFRYDPIRRHLQLEALFHFGPEAGNGTLVEDAFWLDDELLLTVNRGSRNLSLVDTGKPDLVGTLEANFGVAACEVNPRAGELYVVERGAHGMLVFDLDYPANPPDTLRLDFIPGAVLQIPGSQYLYFTDEDAGRLVRFNLGGDSEMLSIRVDLKPPLLIASHDDGSAVILASGDDGQLRLIDTRTFNLRPDRLNVGKPVVALDCDADSTSLLLTAVGGCDDSEIWALYHDSGSFTLARRGALGAIVRGVAGSTAGGPVYAVAGGTLFRFGNGTVDRVHLGGYLRSVAVGDGRVYAAGGLDDIYMVDSGLRDAPVHVHSEMGPGPLLLGGGRLYAVNCLSNSITAFRAESMADDVSLLLGVLLGRMYYEDERIVVNNLFRGNVMVLDPVNYRIEEIIQAGGSLHYNPGTRTYAIFDDSSALHLQAPPSMVSANIVTQLPDGVRLFAPADSSDIYAVIDQNRSVSRVNLAMGFRRGQVSLPYQATSITPGGKSFYISAERELYKYSIDSNIGLDRAWSIRPSRVELPWLAADGFSRTRGSLLKNISGGHMIDVFTAPGDIAAIRLDPDTARVWVATGGQLYAFDPRKRDLLASFNLRFNINDVFLANGGRNVYAIATDQVMAVDRYGLVHYDDIRAGGRLIYGRRDDLFLIDPDNNRRLVVADGLRGDVFEEVDMPLVPSDAAANDERLFLLGGTQGSLAIYVNYLDSSRMPRSNDRQVWDTEADRRAGFHR